MISLPKSNFNFINIMSKHYSLEAHLLHSGLQMVWKQLNVFSYMDAKDVLGKNRDTFGKVAEGIYKRFGISCTDEHKKESAEMLYYTFEANLKKSHWIIARSTSHGNEYNVTLKGAEVVVNDQATEWSQDEAMDMLREIKSRFPGQSFWVEQRIPRYVSRVYEGKG
jgi:hypothetical protein